jgi:transcriptional regulator with XRE-family HTH domain
MRSEKTLEDLLQAIGNNLYNLRKHRKESLEAVAEANKLPAYLLSRIENGNYPNCPVFVLLELCAYYNISTEVLLKGYCD